MLRAYGNAIEHALARAVEHEVAVDQGGPVMSGALARIDDALAPLDPGEQNVSWLQSRARFNVAVAARIVEQRYPHISGSAVLREARRWSTT